LPHCADVIKVTTRHESDWPKARKISSLNGNNRRLYGPWQGPSEKQAEDSRQEMGRVAARLLAVMESSLAEMANALAAEPSMSPRDTLRTLRSAWRGVRARAARAIGAEAGAIEPLVDEEEAA
jgi:hypothetical protein